MAGLLILGIERFYAITIGFFGHVFASDTPHKNKHANHQQRPGDY